MWHKDLSGGYVLSHVVEADEDRWMIKDIAKKRLIVSMRQLRLLRYGGVVRRNGCAAFLTARADAGDRLEFCWPAPTDSEIESEQMPLTIIHEDDDILVIDKPPGIVVHPTGSYQTGTLAAGILYYLRQSGHRGAFHPVHRLDKDTSGVILIAKHRMAHRLLDLQIKRRLIRRTYCAVISTHLYPSTGTITTPIARDQNHPVRRIVSDCGYAAHTDYTTTETYVGGSLLTLSLGTGRTHQIRVHLQSIGAPIIGDTLYGSTSLWIGRQALHATDLAFTHPLTGCELHLSCPLPKDIMELLEHIKISASEVR